jgi:hypothetical protein
VRAADVHVKRLGLAGPIMSACKCAPSHTRCPYRGVRIRQAKGADTRFRADDPGSSFAKPSEGARGEDLYSMPGPSKAETGHMSLSCLNIKCRSGCV